MEEWIKQIPIIDTHLHLWDINRLEYPWLNEVPAIKKTFLIEDYQQASKKFTIEKMVFVQCECLPQQCLKEVNFALEQASKDARIKGIIPYISLEQGESVIPLLDEFKENNLIKGVRRMYDDNPGLCYSSSFLDALNILPSYNLNFDVSIKQHSLTATIQMIKECGDTVFVLDHLGKPNIKHGGFKTFQKDMDILASFPNVVAKISGLITEADWDYWTVADLKPYIGYAIKAFGFERLLFGGDWPVVLLAGTYERWLNALSEVLQNSTSEELSMLFHDNAERIYKL